MRGKRKSRRRLVYPDIRSNGICSSFQFPVLVRVSICISTASVAVSFIAIFVCILFLISGRVLVPAGSVLRKFDLRAVRGFLCTGEVHSQLKGNIPVLFQKGREFCTVPKLVHAAVIFQFQIQLCDPSGTRCLSGSAGIGFLIPDCGKDFDLLSICDLLKGKYRVYHIHDHRFATLCIHDQCGVILYRIRRESFVAADPKRVLRIGHIGGRSRQLFIEFARDIQVCRYLIGAGFQLCPGVLVLIIGLLCFFLFYGKRSICGKSAGKQDADLMCPCF